MTRKQAREVALHALYALTFAPEAVEADIADMLTPPSLAAWRDECDIYGSPAGEEALYIESVVRGAWAQAAALDTCIAGHTKGWQINRISRIALILMRMALYEPTAIPGVTQAVAINEAVELCKHYDSEETAAFINGILGTLARADGEQA